MEIKEVLDLGGGFAKNQFNLAIKIFTTRSRFVEEIEHGSEKEFKRAIAYAAFLSIVGLITAIPSLRLIGVNFESMSFILIDTVLTVGTFFVYGCTNHIAAKILKGSGTLTSSVVITVYMSTFLMALSFIALPLTSITSETFVAGSMGNVDFGTDIIESEEYNYASYILMATVLIGGIYWFVIQAKSFGKIHGFGAIRVWSFGILALIAQAIIMEILLFPVLEAYHRAFISQ